MIIIRSIVEVRSKLTDVQHLGYLPRIKNMGNKEYPTQQILATFWWYRLGVVFKWLIVIGGFASTMLLNEKALWYLDGLTNALIWYITLTAIWQVLKYIIFGSAPKTENFEKERNALKNKIIGLLILGTMYFLIMISVLDTFGSR
jgi:hypothetical protein